MNRKVFKFNAANVTSQFLIVLILRNSLKSTIPNQFSFTDTPDTYLHGATQSLILETVFLINLFGYFIYMLPLKLGFSPTFTRILNQIKIVASI